MIAPPLFADAQREKLLLLICTTLAASNIAPPSLDDADIVLNCDNITEKVPLLKRGSIFVLSSETLIADALPAMLMNAPFKMIADTAENKPTTEDDLLLKMEFWNVTEDNTSVEGPLTDTSDEDTVDGSEHPLNTSPCKLRRGHNKPEAVDVVLVVKEIKFC